MSVEPDIIHAHAIAPVPAPPGWEPNWISHRASLANVDRRRDRGEEVTLCPGCGCEADIVPVPHSPRCTALLAPAPEPEPRPEPPLLEVVADPPVSAAARDYHDVDEDGLYGCKTPGCTGRAKSNRGPLAYRCEPCAVPLRRDLAAKISEGARRARGTVAPTEPKPEEPRWLVNVKGTGLRYRTVDEAYLAAAEIEADGERVAQAARFDGNEAKADQAIDAARELAEKIRAAARIHDSSRERADDPGPEEGPRSPTPGSGERDDQQPPMGARTAAATGHGTGAPEDPEPAPAPNAISLRAALLEWVRATREVFDAVERELTIEADPGTVARVIVQRLEIGADDHERR